MKLTYIFHSGFALENDDAVLIFDYWMDPARVVPRLLSGAKKKIHIRYNIKMRVVSGKSHKTRRN